MLNVGQQVGGTLGLSSLVAVFSSAARDAGPHAPHTTLADFQNYVFTHGTVGAFKAGAVFALAGLVVAFVLIRVNPGTEAHGGPPVP
jgi:hypothetical protein